MTRRDRRLAVERWCSRWPACRAGAGHRLISAPLWLC